MRVAPVTVPVAWLCMHADLERRRALCPHGVPLRLRDVCVAGIRFVRTTLCPVSLCRPSCMWPFASPLYVNLFLVSLHHNFPKTWQNGITVSATQSRLHEMCGRSGSTTIVKPACRAGTSARQTCTGPCSQTRKQRT